jgi:hypothetical protein
MSKIPNEERLARLLDTTPLARVVPLLPPETVHQLIRHRGLEACGELVAAATPGQLTAVFDLDLWRHARPGRDELFDVGRFGQWIEVLVDTGESVAARTVAALDKDLVVAGLSRYMRVLDPGIFEPVAQSDDEPPDRHEAMREGDSIPVGATVPDDSSGGSLESAVGGYLVRARRADAWDAIVALLHALETEFPGDFHEVMQRCRRLSNSRPEIDGLDDLLPEPAQQLHDVAIERERRRSLQGYATPADARAFLDMARQPKDTRFRTTVNPIVTAYFRAADEAAEPSPDLSRPPDGALDTADVRESIDAVMELLADAGVVPERPRALLEAADAGPEAARLTRLRRLMGYVRDHHEIAYFTRSRELAFLANVLLAGCSVQTRAFTPREASDGAAAICNLGLEYWPDAPESLLIDHDLVTAFEVGWSVLHRDVSMFAAEQLVAILSSVSDLGDVDRDVRLGLAALRRALVRQRKAGTPWHARGAVEILSMLDVTAWIGVLGLLDECPVLPAALTAVVEGRTTQVSPTNFDFISTAAQIGDVRIFLGKLPALLSR